MVEQICVYKGNKYTSFIVMEDKLRLIICESKDGFENIVENGEIDEDLFFKDIFQEEADEIYALKYTVIFENVECETMYMDKSILERGYLSIVTDNVEFAKNNEFRRFDKWEYIKEVPIKDIEILVLQKKQLYSKNEETFVEKVNLVEFLNDLDN